MQVIKECICLIGTKVCVNTTDSHIHFSHLPSIGVAFLTVNGHTEPIASVFSYELDRLNKHTARTAAGIVHTAVGKRLQNCHNRFNNAGGGIKLAALYALICRKLSDTVFVSSAEQVFAFLGISHIHIGKQVNDVAQYTLVQIRTCVIFRQYIFKALVLRFNRSHSVVNDSTDFGGMSRRSDFAPTGTFGDEKDVVRCISVSVVLKAVAISYQLIVFLFKSTRYVTQEYKTYDNLSVLCRRNVSP